MARVELIHGDSFGAMKAYPDRHFELLLWDGAYGIGEGKKAAKRSAVAHRVKQRDGSYREVKPSNYEGGNWDDALPEPEFFKEGIRCSKQQVFFGANYFAHILSLATEPFTAPRREAFDEFLEKHPTGWIVWDKCSNNCFSDCELIYTSFQLPSFIFRYLWSGHMQGKDLVESHKQRGDKRTNERRVHPTQKPTNLYRMILQRFAKPGYRVLDPFAGSGSSLIVAEQMGLEAVGYEINDVYYQAAAARMETYRRRRRDTGSYQVAEQLRLF